MACVMVSTPVFAKTMYVVSKIKYETPYSHWIYKFTYRKDNGLVKKCLMTETPEYYMTYHYNKDGSLKELRDFGEQGMEGTQTYKYDSKGRLAGMVIKRYDNKKVFYTNTYTYKWGTNTCKVTASEMSPETFKFDENGRLIQDAIKVTDGTLKYKYWYDANGYVRSRKVIYKSDSNSENDSSFVTRYENKLSSKRLSKINYIDEEGFNSISITYKTVEVPSSYVSKAKKQQDYMLKRCALNYNSFYFSDPAM